MDSHDYMVIKFVPGTKMAQFIEKEVKEIDNNDTLPVGIQSYIACENREKATVTVPDMEWIKARLALQGLYLCQMMQGVELVLPSPPVIPRNPELEARCQRLRWEQQEREYRAMTKMVDPRRQREPEESIAYQVKQINRQLIGVAQFVFSVAAGFVFGFLGLELIFGGLDMRVRLLSGIGCALVIAVAEIYFLIMHLSNEDTVTDKGLDEKLVDKDKPRVKESTTADKPHQD